MPRQAPSDMTSLAAQIESTVPTVTGRTAALSAHRSRSDNPEPLRAPIRPMPKAKQLGGAIMTISIQTKGIVDKSPVDRRLA